MGYLYGKHSLEEPLTEASEAPQSYLWMMLRMMGCFSSKYIVDPQNNALTEAEGKALKVPQVKAIDVPPVETDERPPYALYLKLNPEKTLTAPPYHFKKQG
jgi:hypothetical protein